MGQHGIEPRSMAYEATALTIKLQALLLLFT